MIKDVHLINYKAKLNRLYKQRLKFVLWSSQSFIDAKMRTMYESTFDMKG